MRVGISLLFSILFLIGLSAQQHYKGFFDFELQGGKVLLEVDKIDTEFLFVCAISSGLGSNDLGIDRGKLGRKAVVKFVKAGDKLLLIQSNQDFRAQSQNQEEKQAVQEAFAQSILWGGEIISTAGNTYTVDISELILTDQNNLIHLLKQRKQGKFKIDKKRCAVDDQNLLAFPKNIELESYLTFYGEPEGGHIKSVVPSPSSISIKQHLSFIELPDDDYKPRVFHPYSGYFPLSFFDYASPIDQDLEKRLIYRHRLEKKDTSLALSEAKEPIIYYVDGGCPEPIRSALIEGAQWWDQAFEAIGYKNAFQVKVLPADAHPLDVRYNVIQWVHRSTRGWSYGDSVSDPRTGEILKGHVSLGSLRVRQDFMIAEGLLSPYKASTAQDNTMIEMALARLRQLSAHEVGHTLGLAHNFAASYNNRSSVMDYPHPFVELTQNGELDFSKAYDDKIGAWDKQTIAYGYSQFESGADENQELQKIMLLAKQKGLLYISDSDARPQGGAHPYAHLWDNGSDPIKELYRLMDLRRDALDRFGLNTINNGTPYSELEKKLVPVYLMHRYQVEAVVKLIGGVNYSYGVKGFDEILNEPVHMAIQEKAIEALLTTLKPESLKLPDNILKAIPPAAIGHGRTRESFGSTIGPVFDPLAGARDYVAFVMHLMLHPERLARLDLTDEYLMDYLDNLRMELFRMRFSVSEDLEFILITQKAFIMQLMRLSMDPSISSQVSASAVLALEDIYKQLNKSSKTAYSAHVTYLKQLIDGSKRIPALFKLPNIDKIPPGSPIGCGHGSNYHLH